MERIGIPETSASNPLTLRIPQTAKDFISTEAEAYDII